MANGFLSPSGVLTAVGDLGHTNVTFGSLMGLSIEEGAWCTAGTLTRCLSRQEISDPVQMVLLTGRG